MEKAIRYEHYVSIANAELLLSKLHHSSPGSEVIDLFCPSVRVAAGFLSWMQDGQGNREVVKL
jgi:hypothetical protein